MKMITQLMLVISAIVITEVAGSKKHVCLIWRISRDTLKLTCTVRNLRHQVLIYDPSGIEQGYCIEPFPVILCNSTFSNGTMTQNISTNVTELSVRGKIDTNLNGKWRCTHGTNVGEATVDVTVPAMNDSDASFRNLIRGKIVQLRCTSWALIPFTGGLGLALFIVWATERKKSVNNCSKGIGTDWRCLSCIKFGKCTTNSISKGKRKTNAELYVATYNVSKESVKLSTDTATAKAPSDINPTTFTSADTRPPLEHDIMHSPGTSTCSTPMLPTAGPAQGMAHAIPPNSDITVAKIITTLIAGILVIVIPIFISGDKGPDCPGYAKGASVGLGVFLSIIVLLVTCKQGDKNKNENVWKASIIGPFAEK